MEYVGVRYLMPIKRCDDADDLEGLIYVILERTAQIFKVGSEAH